MKKKTGPVIAVALTVAAAATLVALDQAGWPGLAPRLAQRAGYGLQVDPATRLHLIWSPRLEAPQLRVVGTNGDVLGDARDVLVAWQWRDVWNWRHGAPLRLRAVQAQQLQLGWTRDAQGRTPWPLNPGAGDAGAQPTPMPQIDRLVIHNGSAHVDDAPLQLLADARFSTEADGHWQADVKGRLRQQQLQLQAQASAGLALLSSADSDAPPVQLRVAMSQGPQRLTFTGTAASLLDARALDGQLQVRGSSLAAVGRPFGVTLPNTPDFDLAGRLQHASGVWQLDGVKARIGGSRLGGDFAFDTRGPRPQLSGLLRGGPLRLADLGPAVGTDTPPSRSGRVLPDRPLDLPSLQAMDARVAVALNELDLGTAKLEPFAPVNVSVILEDGVLKLQHLNAGVAGGEITGAATLDTRPSPPLWQASLDAQGLAIERWLHPTVKPLTDNPITGKLKAQLDVQGHGRSTAELLGSMSGPVQLRLENGSVSHLLTEAMGLDVAQGLGMLIKGDDHLALNCARVDGRFQDGVLRPRTALIDNRDSRIDLDGRVSLKDERLDLRLVAKPKDFSPLTLRAPVRLQGTLADPRVALEGRKLGGRALAAVALGALATPAALLAFVDPGEDLPPVDCSLSPRAAAPAAGKR
ncbi:AsmA family protein [Roseateles cellulosilyticus]|uniref:AsmA family protein n=1 Tax=Pelomonas cellulosilytica TaxID=2906762 RepID=A0ABS8XUZ5_9BURK|nr:AsmA family protein [Pelomonas sp. P8]MCE4556487.1 AsmA family protein [Pelomonas sp. P8]